MAYIGRNGNYLPYHPNTPYVHLPVNFRCCGILKQELGVAKNQDSISLLINGKVWGLRLPMKGRRPVEGKLITVKDSQAISQGHSYLESTSDCPRRCLLCYKRKRKKLQCFSLLNELFACAAPPTIHERHAACRLAGRRACRLASARVGKSAASCSSLSPRHSRWTTSTTTGTSTTARTSTTASKRWVSAT